MPIIKYTPPEPEQHLCDLPNPESLGYGSLWLCPDCGRIHKVCVFCTMPYWKSLSMWRSRRITKRMGLIDGLYPM